MSNKGGNFSSPKLSATEKKIAIMICEELTSEQIANKLQVKKTTINTYKARLFKKLNVVSSIGIALHAVKSRLYDLENQGSV